MNQLSERNRIIIRCSLYGIGLNLILFILKVIVAAVIHSESILLDAANGLADMFSLLVAILSVITAGKKADRSHPFGYGRLEYLFSFLLIMFIISMGIRGIVLSVNDIIHHDFAPEYTVISGVLMGASFVIKMVYGVYAKKTGKRVRSITITLSGIESMHDSFISIVILAAMILYHFTGVVLEHWISIVFAVMLIHDGISLIRESMRNMLGTRIDPEYQKAIKQLILEEKEVLFVSNLVIHNYGEDRNFGSVDIEVDADMKASAISRLSRKIIRKARKEGLTLTSVGIISSSAPDPEVEAICDTIIDLARKDPSILRVQGITVDLEENTIDFSIVQKPAKKGDISSRRKMEETVSALYPEMTVEVDTAVDT